MGRRWRENALRSQVSDFRFQNSGFRGLAVGGCFAIGVRFQNSEFRFQGFGGGRLLRNRCQVSEFRIQVSGVWRWVFKF